MLNFIGCILTIFLTLLYGFVLLYIDTHQMVYVFLFIVMAWYIWTIFILKPYENLNSMFVLLFYFAIYCAIFDYRFIIGNF